MIKFGFKIKTRGGTVVDNLIFAARERAEAERKVMQIYHHCEILDCHEVQPSINEETLDLEHAIGLIGKELDAEPPATDQPDYVTNPAASSSSNKAE
ncbi:MAG: hypothetical protein IH604_04740 [Burkholderiales bacterium]|nr:hypothetical protein [Burkholderiales bacterium]